mmetsp:Transcript_47053/g.121571  ORF Transcript_47053/g.121571 Transcript_47053/m.121571 type:complete len:108 (-) Transcript_47053:2697-3020(-)
MDRSTPMSVRLTSRREVEPEPKTPLSCGEAVRGPVGEDYFSFSAVSSSIEAESHLAATGGGEKERRAKEEAMNAMEEWNYRWQMVKKRRDGYLAEWKEKYASPADGQ